MPLRQVARFDDAMVARLARSRPRRLDSLVARLGNAGRAGLPGATIALAYAVARPEVRRQAAGAIATTLGGYASALALKALTERRRPCERRQIRPLVECPDGSSMPSDQAAAAFASALALQPLAPRATPALFAGATAIGSIRVYAGVHYPSDAVAGAVLGLGVALAARSLPRHRKAPFPGPFE